MPARAFHSLFENLFDRGLEPDSAFSDALAQAGYRASQPLAMYPAEVWKACLEVAWQHRFPTLSADQAYRHLGRETTEGYFRSALGPIFTEIIPLLPMHAFFGQLESYTRIGRSDVKLEFRELLSDRFRIRTLDPLGVNQWFFVGALEGVLERKSLQSEWTIEGPPTDYLVSCRWWK
jgi:uncharacterized protein (TIGR02265 family)